MSLDTQTFGITQHWLSVALMELPSSPDIFTSAKLSVARKAFLAGSRQLTAIKNWLSCAGIIELSRGSAELTELGQLMAAKDPAAKHAWTWWLFHLHLCANVKSLPYITFFMLFDVDSRSWLRTDAVVSEITKHLNEHGEHVVERSVSTYFDGIESSLRPGQPFHELGLIERRTVDGETGRDRIRRRLIAPPDLVTAYTALLLHERFFFHEQTVETRRLLEAGLAKAVGQRSADTREALTRIHQSAGLGKFIQYSRVPNLDSVSFPKNSLHAVRMHGYASGEVQWP